MAKSLRSKWKRKMRAVKRNKNEGRVMKQLKETLTKDQIIMTEDMVKYQELDQVLKTKQEKEEQEKQQQQEEVAGASMDVDSKRDKKTLLDANGQYPEWVNCRQAKKLREKRKAKKKGTVRKSARNKKFSLVVELCICNIRFERLFEDQILPLY